MMKSKYIVYATIVFMFVAQVDAMRRPSFQKEYELRKELWHQECVYNVIKEVLPQTNNKKSLHEHYISPLSFEVLGSKNFIAAELGKKLDNATSADKHFKKIAECRDKALITSMNRQDYSIFLKASIWSINLNALLPFIQSLEHAIKERIKHQNRTIEIEWRKKAYKHLNWKNGRCYDHEKCLELDIEKEFSLEELKSDDYRDYVL